MYKFTGLFCGFLIKLLNLNNLNSVIDHLMEDIEELEERLIELEQEHRDMDEIIERLRQTPPVDFLQVKRLQKKKLILKDEIQKLKSALIPDIIA